MEYSSIAKKDIEQAWEELFPIYKEHLEEYGVKLPKKFTTKYIWLAILYIRYKSNPNEMVSKSSIAKVVNRILPNTATDQQVRHLKRDGWKLESDGKGGHILDPYKVSPEFSFSNVRRARLPINFNEIKEQFRNRCATCGAKEGKKSWRYGEDKIKLHEAHQDPAKPVGMGNIIPQCQFCNQAYQNDFVFDNKGRVTTVASVAPIKRASKKVKKLIVAYLNEQEL